MTQEEVLQEEKRFDEWYASQRDIFAKFESPAKNIAWLAWQAAQQGVQSDVCPVCEGKGKVANTRGVLQFCIPCDGTGQRR